MTKSKKGRANHRNSLLITGFALSALLVTACSTATGGTSASTSGNSGSSGLATTKQLAASLEQRPTSISVTQPIGKPIPTAKTVTFISCGVPACDTIGKTFSEGAALLGWTTKIVSTSGTPESIKAAWQEAVTAKPDAVVSSGTTTSVVADQLKALAAENVPVVLYAVTDQPQGVSAVIGGPSGEAFDFGQPMAAYIASNSDGKASTLYVNLPSYPILQDQLSGFKQIYRQGCSGCNLTVYDVPATATSIPPLIVSELRSHPNINYVAVCVDSLTVGLPAALKAAGLQNKVKVIGSSSDVPNFEYIATGQEAAGVPNAFYDDGYQMVDALALIFTGQSPASAEVNPPRMLLTESNLPSSSQLFPLVPDYKQQFLKLWGHAG